jgi:hypothetical protein
VSSAAPSDPEYPARVERAARDFAPEARSLLPAVLPRRPGLVLLAGPIGCGEKQSLAMQLSVGFATGSAPWHGAPPLPPRSVIYVSLNTTSGQLLSAAHELAGAMGAEPSGERRLHRLGRDAAFRLEDLRSHLDRISAANPAAPIRLVVLDSLGLLIPPDVERSPAQTQRWLAGLNARAEAAGAFLLLLADGAANDLRRVVSLAKHVLTLRPGRYDRTSATLHTLDHTTLRFDVEGLASGSVYLRPPPDLNGLDVRGEVLAVMTPGIEYSLHAIAEAVAHARGRPRASKSARQSVEAALFDLASEGRVKRFDRPRGWRFVRT